MSRLHVSSWAARFRFLGVALSLALPAAAQRPEATAEQLFQEGRQLMQDGKIKEGCAKLAQSQKLDPAAGTLLNLGECYEKNKQIASALSSYKQAWELARERKRADWTSFAEERMRELEPRVPRVRVTGALPQGAHAELDGRPIDLTDTGVVLRVDAGEHRVTVVSGERELMTRTFVAVEGKTEEVVVEGTQKKSAAPGPQPPPVSVPPPSSNESSAPGVAPAVWIVGGSGLAAAALGGVFLGVREAQVSSIVSDCGPSGSALPASRYQGCVDRGSSVGTMMGLSIAAFSLGAVLLGSALVMHLTSGPGDVRKDASVRASCFPGIGAASCVVRF
ncbi:MAG: tetratricopeptide repeat protein [Polyangiaceae bacterium]